MITIDKFSPIVKNTILDRIQYVIEKNESGEKIKRVQPISASDFDGVSYNMEVDESDPSLLFVSASVSGFEKLDGSITNDYLKSVYGDDLLTADDGYHIKIRVACGELGEKSEDEREKFAEKVAQLRYHVYFATFNDAFDRFTNGNKFNTIPIFYRPEETIYISNVEKSALQVIFSFKFLNKVDAALGKLAFLEFAAARKKSELNTAPGISYSHQVLPLELQNADIDIKEAADAKSFGFIALTLFDRTIAPEERFNNVISMINFRTYMLYHLKCAKAFMHLKFRSRVDKLIKQLDAAKDLSGVKKVRKTASGRYLSSEMSQKRAQESQRY